MNSLRIAKPACIDQLGDSHALLEASAGTGKTYAIEHLVVELLLCQDRNLSEILVVTFTKKAASEMSGRIRQRMLEICEATTRDEGEGPAWSIDDRARQKLQDAILQFEQAPISTIHSFCQRILDEHSLLTGRLPAVHDLDLRELFRTCWHAVIREDFAASSDEREVFETLLEMGIGVEVLERWLWEAHHELVAPADSATPLDWSALRPTWAPDQLDGLKRVYVDALEAFPEDLSVVLEPISKTSRARLESDIQELQQTHTGTRDLSALSYTLHFLHASKEFRGRAPFKKRVEQKGDIGNWLRAAGGLYEALPSIEAVAIRTLLPFVKSRFDKVCQQHGATDHDRLLHDTLSALTGPVGDELLVRLRQKYRVALVDEFQDTDDTQWAIFRKIFVEGTPQTRFLAVGDPKQAIYGFRGGDIHTYFAARKAIHAPIVVLDANYRSSPAMVHAYNELLATRVDDVPFLGGGEVNYNEPVLARAKTQGLEDAEGNALAPLQILKISPDLQGNDAKQALRAAIANQIQELVTGPVRMHEEEGRRALRYGDIMCLTLSHSEAEALVDVLHKAGIPAAHYRSAGLWSGDEAGDLSDVLNSLAAPQDRALRLKAWRSAFFEVELQALQQAQSLSSHDPRYRAWREWVSLAKEQNWHTLFARLRIATSMNRRGTISEDWERKLANFETLFAQAHDLALRECPDIVILARRVHEKWVEKSRSFTASRDEEDMKPAPQDADAVRVMTTFAAKGLEAPVVCFAAGIGGGAPNKNKTHRYHDHTGQRLVWAGSPAADVKEILKEEQDWEARRLLYVLLTRPKVRLVLPLLHEEKGKKHSVQPRYQALQATLSKWVNQNDGPLPAWMEYLEVNDLDAPPAVGQAELPLPPPPAFTRAQGQGARQAADEVRKIAGGISFTSFTQLKPKFASPWERPPAAKVRELDVPQGKDAGHTIHNMLERVPWLQRAEERDFFSWRSQEAVTAYFIKEWQHNRWSESQRLQAEHWIFRALHAPIALPSELFSASGATSLKEDERAALETLSSQGLGSLGTEFHREMEFHLPMPANVAHLITGHAYEGATRRWRYGKGVLKGAIDFAFECGGRVFLGDWKTNALEAYTPEHIKQSVVASYEGQVRIYTLALVRLCGIANRAEYEARIGGAIYVYLRGFDGAGNGVYAARPSWEDIRELEELLLRKNGLEHDEPAYFEDDIVNAAIEVRENDEVDDGDVEPASFAADSSLSISMPSDANALYGEEAL